MTVDAEKLIREAKLVTEKEIQEYLAKPKPWTYEERQAIIAEQTREESQIYRRELR